MCTTCILQGYLLRVTGDCPQSRRLNIPVDLTPITAFTCFHPLKQKAEKVVFKVLYSETECWWSKGKRLDNDSDNR